MANRARKDRGMRTQLVVAQWFAARGWPYAESTGAARIGADITGTPDIAVEVKARSGFEPLSWIRQAVGAANGRLPFVVFRCNGQGEARVEDWPCLIRLGDLTAVLRDAGYGDGGKHAAVRPAMAPESDAQPEPVPVDLSDPERPGEAPPSAPDVLAAMSEAVGRGMSGPEQQALGDLADTLTSSGALALLAEVRQAWADPEGGHVRALGIVAEADPLAVGLALWLTAGAEFAGQA